jgi:hypothetical protein
MRALLLGLLLAITGTAQAVGTGFYYNPERDGEGVIVTIDDENRFAFAFFTFWNANYPIPPSPSPSPPPLVWSCDNCAIWYVGAAPLNKNVSVGDLYTSEAIDYPNAEPDGSLDHKLLVGEYTMLYSDGGWKLQVDCGKNIPNGIYMCKNVFDFNTLLIGM